MNKTCRDRHCDKPPAGTDTSYCTEHFAEQHGIDYADLHRSEDAMTSEVEAHWRYQLECMTNWGHASCSYLSIPDEVHWLREEARYRCHLADAQQRRAATFVGVMDQ